MAYCALFARSLSCSIIEHSAYLTHSALQCFLHFQCFSALSAPCVSFARCAHYCVHRAPPAPPLMLPGVFLPCIFGGLSLCIESMALFVFFYVECGRKPTIIPVLKIMSVGMRKTE